MPSEAATTTIYHLEMLDRGAFRPKPAPPRFGVSKVSPADPALNRSYYARVGAPWRWTARLAWSDERWRRYVLRDALGTWIGRAGDDPVGYFELESQAGGDVELAYFGLLPEFIGRGLGGPLLSAAVERAWRLPGTRRLWVHTCTDDHAHALDNYLGRGFELFKTERIGRGA